MAVTEPTGVHDTRPAETDLLHTAFCGLVGVQHPIVQSAMGYVSTPQLVVAVSKAGGLGLLAAATMSFEELRESIAAVHDQTDKPFGVNLRSDQDDVMKRAELLVRRRVKLASFALAPRRDVIDALKSGGVVCMPSVGAPRHAERVVGWGVDAVIVQGSEAGGHTGSVPTSVLLPSVVDAVDVPVIAAGGFSDGRGLVAALAYGAAGVAMGTRFLLTQESPVAANIKARYLDASMNDTLVTAKVDGHPHRMLRTPFVEQVDRSGRWRSSLLALRSLREFMAISGSTPAALVREGWALRKEHGYTFGQVVLAANAPMLCRAAMVDGREDYGILTGGQVMGTINDLPTCRELIARTVEQAYAALDRLGACSATHPAEPTEHGAREVPMEAPLRRGRDLGGCAPDALDA